MHKRKVEDVRRWLNEAFDDSSTAVLKKYRVRRSYSEMKASSEVISADPSIDWECRYGKNGDPAGVSARDELRHFRMAELT